MTQNTTQPQEQKKGMEMLIMMTILALHLSFSWINGSTGGWWPYWLDRGDDIDGPGLAVKGAKMCKNFPPWVKIDPWVHNAAACWQDDWEHHKFTIWRAATQSGHDCHENFTEREFCRNKLPSGRNWIEAKPIQLVCEIHTKLKRTWLFKIY